MYIQYTCVYIRIYMYTCIIHYALFSGEEGVGCSEHCHAMLCEAMYQVW